MSDPPALRPEPSRPVPPSVRYAQVVLSLQGGIWAAGAIAGVIGAVEVLTGMHGRLWTLFVLAIGSSAFAGGMATVNTLLARRLVRSRSQRTRRAVITVELAMTCFGVLWFFGGAYTATGLPADMFTLAGLGGGGLSLAAVLALMRRRARQYAAAPAVSPEGTGRGPASRPMLFWRRPAPVRAGRAARCGAAGAWFSFRTAAG